MWLIPLSGVAPVIERSGKSSWTRWRYFCPKFTRQAFVEYAGESIRGSVIFAAVFSDPDQHGFLPHLKGECVCLRDDGIACLTGRFDGSLPSGEHLHIGKRWSLVSCRRRGVTQISVARIGIGDVGHRFSPDMQRRRARQHR